MLEVAMEFLFCALVVLTGYIGWSIVKNAMGKWD